MIYGKHAPNQCHDCHRPATTHYQDKPMCLWCATLASKTDAVRAGQPEKGATIHASR